MPITAHYVNNNTGSVFEFNDVVSTREFVETFEAHFNLPDEKFLPLRFSLLDLTNIRKVEVTVDAIQGMGLVARKAYDRNAEGIVAFAASSDLTYGLAKVWLAWTRPKAWVTNVLRDRASAEQWLREELEARYGMADVSFDVG